MKKTLFILSLVVLVIWGCKTSPEVVNLDFSLASKTIKGKNAVVFLGDTVFVLLELNKVDEGSKSSILVNSSMLGYCLMQEDKNLSFLSTIDGVVVDKFIEKKAERSFCFVPEKPGSEKIVFTASLEESPIKRTDTVFINVIDTASVITLVVENQERGNVMFKGEEPLKTAYKNVKKGSQETAVFEPTEGYAFLGWYDENDLLISDQMEYTFIVETPLFLKAKSVLSTPYLSFSWDQKMGRAFFQYEDGGAVSEGNLPYGTKIKCIVTTNENITFIGWYDKEDNLFSTETSYTHILKEDTQITAKFKKVLFELKYSVDDKEAGSIVASSEDKFFPPGAHLTFSFKPNDGYDFLYWTVNGEKKVDKIIFFNISENTEVLAFTQKVTYFNFSYSWDQSLGYAFFQNEKGNSISGGKFPSETKIKCFATANEGAEFKGWYDEKNNLLSVETEYIHVLTEDINIVAKFVQAKYIVTFKVNEKLRGNPVASMNLKEFYLKGDPCPSFTKHYPDKYFPLKKIIIKEGAPINKTTELTPLEYNSYRIQSDQEITAVFEDNSKITRTFVVKSSAQSQINNYSDFSGIANYCQLDGVLHNGGKIFSLRCLKNETISISFDFDRDGFLVLSEASKVLSNYKGKKVQINMSWKIDNQPQNPNTKYKIYSVGGGNDSSYKIDFSLNINPLN